MRVPFVLCAVFASSVAMAQVSDFKIYPTGPRFDQACTSFTSRCSLATGQGGEILQEIPAGGRGLTGSFRDYFRGVGLRGSGPGCEITHIHYVSQNAGQPSRYDVRVREVDPVTLLGPDVNNTLLDVPLTLPPNGTFGVTLTLGSPLPVPCFKSWFVGLRLAPGSASSGQSVHGAFYDFGSKGDVPRDDAPPLHWQIDAAGNVGQCSVDLLWHIAVSVEAPTLVAGNLHGTARCPSDPAWGAGGIWPDNSGRGDGAAFLVRAAASEGASVFLFVSDRAAAPVFVPGLLDGGLLLGPPLLQATFGGNTIQRGTAQIAPAFLGQGRLVGLDATAWWQALIVAPTAPLPLPMTNAAAVSYRR